MVRQLRTCIAAAVTATVHIAGLFATGCVERGIEESLPAEPEAIDGEVSEDDFHGDARMETTIVMHDVVAVGDIDGDGRDDLEVHHGSRATIVSRDGLGAAPWP